MSTLTGYNGLQVITPDPTGAGGLAINGNFKALSTHVDTSDPSGGSSAGFSAGSRWFNSATNTEWICTNASGSGTWVVIAGWGASPVGSIVAWLMSFTGTPSLPDGWVQCNGQVLSEAGSVYNGATLPDLNGASSGTKRFLRGSTTSGSTGGAETHTHSFTASLCVSLSGVQSGGSFSAVSAIGGSSATTASASSLPSYYEIVHIMRVK